MTARYCLTILTLTLLTTTLWPSSAHSQTTPACTTDRAKFWICAGDTAWTRGYLVTPSTMGRLTAMSSEVEGLGVLVRRLRIERDALRLQRDDALRAVQLRDVRLFAWEERERSSAVWAEASPEVDWLDRAAWAGGGVVTGVVVGVLVVVFAGGR